MGTFVSKRQMYAPQLCAFCFGYGYSCNDTTVNKYNAFFILRTLIILKNRILTSFVHLFVDLEVVSLESVGKDTLYHQQACHPVVVPSTAYTTKSFEICGCHEHYPATRVLCPKIPFLDRQQPATKIIILKMKRNLGD